MIKYLLKFKDGRNTQVVKCYGQYLTLQVYLNQDKFFETQKEDIETPSYLADEPIINHDTLVQLDFPCFLFWRTATTNNKDYPLNQAKPI